MTYWLAWPYRDALELVIHDQLKYVWLAIFDFKTIACSVSMQFFKLSSKHLSTIGIVSHVLKQARSIEQQKQVPKGQYKNSANKKNASCQNLVLGKNFKQITKLLIFW